MAKMLAIPSKHLALTVVGPRDAFLASRVQRVDLNTDVPSEDIDELGNPQHAGTVKDIPNVTMTFSAMDVGIKIFSALTGVNPSAYPGAGVDISQLGQADVILHVRNEDAATLVKAAHARRMQVQDFTYSFTAEGNSTEDYTMIGSLKRWFKNNVTVEKHTSIGTTFALGASPIQLKNGDYLLTARLDGDYLEEVPSAPGPGQYSVSGSTVTTGDTLAEQLLVVYQTPLISGTWVDVNDPSMPAAIRGRDANVIISANWIPRVQSITINGNMTSQPVREIGNRAMVGYQRQVPVVEGTLTVLDTDTELIDLLTNANINSGETEFQPAVDEPSTDVSLRITLVDPSDDTEPYTVLKTLVIPKITIVGDSYTESVNENASQVFNFRSATAQLIVYSGAAP